LAGEAGAEGCGLGEEAAEDIEILRLRKAGEIEGVDLFSSFSFLGP
jgi:hypothetical protein